MSRFQMGPLDVRPLCGERIRTLGSRGTQSGRRPEQQAVNGRRQQTPLRTVTYRHLSAGSERSPEEYRRPWKANRAGTRRATAARRSEHPHWQAGRWGHSRTALLSMVGTRSSLRDGVCCGVEAELILRPLGAAIRFIFAAAEGDCLLTRGRRPPQHTSQPTPVAGHSLKH